MFFRWKRPISPEKSIILNKNSNITHTCLKCVKMLKTYLFKVKHKQICNLFTQKTYKKGFLPFIFTICDLGEKIVLLLWKLPVKIAENPTAGIERRLLQVIHIILLLFFNRLIFQFSPSFHFLGGFLGKKPTLGVRRLTTANLRTPTFSPLGKSSGSTPSM